MENVDNQAEKKLYNFFNTSLDYYGKEIGLTSGQYFSIYYIRDPDKEQAGEDRYAIQYGFPQSGCVELDFSRSQENNSYTIHKVVVYAPPVGEDIIMTNYAPRSRVGNKVVTAKIGLDMGTQKHTDLDEIVANPNALKMLDIATTDLSQAQILGECNVVAEKGAERIQCCSCTQISNTKGKSR